MALFKSKKEKKTAPTPQPKGRELESSSESVGKEIFSTGHMDVLVRPRITEKATDHQMRNVYTFEIHPKANKRSVSQAVKRIYKVTPVRVNITKNPAKKIWLRGRAGSTNAIKKAYVYLKDGDKIDLI